MIKIDDNQTTIHLTRGDITNSDYNRIAFYLPIWDDTTQEETRYEFQTTDKITFTVYEKKGYTKKEIFKIIKTIAQLGYSNPTTLPELVLTHTDTMKFDSSNQKETYYYDIKLNDTTTIIGSDEDGDKKIIVYPSGEETIS